MKTKICNKCKKEKSIYDFNNYKAVYKYRYYSYTRGDCKICQSIYVKQVNKKYRETHKEKIKEYQKEYRNSHKKEIIQYRQTHKKQINKYQREKRKRNLKFRIVKNLRSRISNALKRNSKSQSLMFLIGCDIEYLMYYLQCQFIKGMNWNNYGKWHIDHIRPCYTFDLSKEIEQQQCFHYANLRPLWAKENWNRGKRQND